jgi:hypothetical protein
MAGEAIKFNASINTAGFDSGAKHLQSVAASAGSTIASHFGKIATAVVGITAAFMGVRAAVQAFSSAIEMGGKLNDLSARTGETAGNLSILQRAFQNAGAGADAVGPTINRLQRAIVEAGDGGKEQAEAFAKLGLNLEDIKAKTPTAQLEAVAKALQGVGNDSDRSAIAMQLLGRSGGELLPLLRAMGVELDIARSQLGGLPGVMDRSTQAFDTIGDNMAAIGAKTTEFAAGLLEKVAPALADLTTRLANIDAAGFGAKLSEYLERTLAWISSTFRLGEALNQIEVAIAGITSGNFGDGLSLMFMTARDTALNAINTIVAAASAAMSTVAEALGKMFNSNGSVVLLLKTAFTIGASYFKEALFNALAQFMDAIGRGGMADAFRYQSETAARSIEMLTGSIGVQIEEVGEQAKTVFGEIPAAFKNSYKANLENPLIDMKDRTAETAAQMERVAAATRSAAFDAEKFGNALAEARLDRLTGDVASSPRPDNAPAPGIFGMDPKDIPAPSPGAPSRGGGAAPKPKSAMDRIRDAADQMDVDAMTEESRARARGARGSARADELEDAGMHRSAAQARAREGRRRERNAENFEDRQAKRAREKELQEMGPLERGRAEQEARKLAREQERMAKEGSKTEKERDREEKESGGGSSGSGGGGKTLSDLWAELKELNTKLPQNAMS